MGGLNWSRVAKERSIERYGADVTFDVETARSRQRAKMSTPTRIKRSAKGVGDLSARALTLDQAAAAKRERVEAKKRVELEALRQREEELAVARGARARMPLPVQTAYRPEGRRDVAVLTRRGEARVIKV